MQTNQSKHEPAKKGNTHTREEYIKAMETQGKEWDTQLTAWGAKADKATGEMKSDFAKWQKQFQDKRGNAHKKLEAVRSAKDEAWDDVKKAADTAWHDVKAAFDGAKSKYN